jgi:hypothetical protein
MTMETIAFVALHARGRLCSRRTSTWTRLSTITSDWDKVAKVTTGKFNCLSTRLRIILLLWSGLMGVYIWHGVILGFFPVVGVRCVGTFGGLVLMNYFCYLGNFG